MPDKEEPDTEISPDDSTLIPPTPEETLTASLALKDTLDDDVISPPPTDIDASSIINPVNEPDTIIPALSLSNNADPLEDTISSLLASMILPLMYTPDSVFNSTEPSLVTETPSKALTPIVLLLDIPTEPSSDILIEEPIPDILKDELDPTRISSTSTVNAPRPSKDSDPSLVNEPPDNNTVSDDPPTTL
jgi:hypothetical protein